MSASSDPLESSGSPVNPAPSRSALLTIFLIVLIDLLGFGIILPVLPDYIRKFDASSTSSFHIGAVTAIFSAFQLVAAPILGAISDRYGRRPVLFFSQMGSAAGYLLLGYVAQHDWASATVGLALLYVARSIDGISAGNISTAQAYIADVTSLANRSRGMALLGI